MAIAVLVIFWVVVGVGVVVIAMSATKKRKSDDQSSRSHNRTIAFGVGITLLVVIGMGVLPAWIMIDNGDADAKTVGGIHLNDNQVRGRELFAANCAVCHTLRASNAVGETGPDLDDLRPPAALVTFAIKNGFANGGQGQMPSGLLSGDDAKDVASYVQAVAGGGSGSATSSTGGGSAATTTPALSPAATAAGKKVFTTNCAACHVLAAAGAKGTVGPDLDQLKPNAPVVAKQVSNGGGAMPPFHGVLTKAQINAVANYVASVAGK